MMKKTLSIVIAVAAISAVAVLMMSNQEVLANHNEVTKYKDPDTSFCKMNGGEVDHWDKVSFTSPRFLRNFDDMPVSQINPGKLGEFKFLQIDPSNVLNLNQLVAEHLTSQGWTGANMTPIKQTDIQIVDVEYSNYCVQNPI